MSLPIFFYQEGRGLKKTTGEEGIDFAKNEEENRTHRLGTERKRTNNPYTSKTHVEQCAVL